MNAMIVRDKRNKALFASMGRLTFDQLVHLRHRGAFSTVSQTFSAWCVAAEKAGIDICSTFYVVSCSPGKRLLKMKDILRCIRQQSALTRRSAGIPSLISGILSAYVEHDSFHEVVLDLLAIADAPSENNDEIWPQVHALNCLRTVFVDARFGPASETHMATSLGIAVSCLDSEA